MVETTKTKTIKQYENGEYVGDTEVVEDKTDAEIIEEGKTELKKKIVLGTATDEERADLTLLIG